MQRLLNLLSLLSLFVMIAATRLVAETTAASDSTAYHELRNRILATDPANQTIPTADALAEAGLYGDAMDLLREFVFTDDTLTTASPPSVKEKPVSWRWSSGIDYYQLQDFDTATMTIEEQREYDRLTETPLSLWTRLMATIRPWDNTEATLRPELFLSEKKGRFETALRYQLPGGFFEYEPLIKAEKWFHNDASGHSSFKPDSTQPSDMLGASVRCNVTNRNRNNRPLRFAVPFSVDWEHYREDRAGYESFVEYRLRPEFELGEGLPPLRFSTEVQYEDYYREHSEYLDVVRISVRGEGNYHTDASRGFAGIAWMGDRYLNDSLPPMINRVEGSFNGTRAFGTHLNLRLRLRGIYEKEAAVREKPALSGKELLIVSATEVLLLQQRLSLGPFLQWEHRFAHPINVSSGEALYIWEGRTALEPGLRIGWSSTVFEAGVRAAYRYEHIEPEFEKADDNRSFRINGECSVLPWKFLSFDGIVDYQYRRYLNEGSRQSENLTVSVNVTVRW